MNKIDYKNRIDKCCPKCKFVLSIDKFNKLSYRYDGVDSYCRLCRNSISRDRNQSKEAKEKLRYSHIKRTYNLSKKQYLILLEKQCGVCAICNLETALYVDHCHTSSKVRGLLCSSCNSGIGHFRDNVLSMKKAIEYLRKNV